VRSDGKGRLTVWAGKIEAYPVEREKDGAGQNMPQKVSVC
jgi:hypothetical protein